MVGYIKLMYKKNKILGWEKKERLIDIQNQMIKLKQCIELNNNFNAERL